MTKYTYTTQVTKDGVVVGVENYTSIKKQIDAAYNLVRKHLDNNECPKHYIDETIKFFSSALRKKNCSKERYYHTMHLDYGMSFKLIRIKN